MRAFRKFNRNYSQHSPNRSKLLSELSVFLSWTPDQFTIQNVADNLSIVEFFRKLNEILLTDEVDYDYHWTVFKVIDIAINNTETRQYLIDTVRIIAGIANYAVKSSASLIEEKQMQVWTLVDRITTGMTIITEEPHLANLIDHLVTSVKRTDLNEEIKMLQVSILTNLCFKNEVAVACLLRFTKSKALLAAIQDHCVYWGKMAMALARFDSTMLEFELIFNLKAIFAAEYFCDLIRSNDQRLLRNVLDMLVVGFERDELSRQIMQNFDFKESIEAALTLIGESEVSSRNPALMSLFLGIVNSILSVSNTSLQSSTPRLFQLIIAHTDATNILPEAIRTIRLIASHTDVADSQDLTPFVALLIENMPSYQTDLPATTEAYQLLIELCRKCPGIIFGLPQEILIKSIDTDTWSFKLTDLNLSMQIHRLQWLLSYTDNSEDSALRRKVTDVMNKRDVHHILASGLKGSNEGICALTMDLIKSKHFPVKSVSKILSGTFTPSVPTTERDCRSPVEIVRPYFSASLETRLNNEVDRLKAKSENANVGMNDYVSMLEYQNIVADAKQENLLTQIKTLSDLNTLQSNEIGGLKIAIRNSLNKISELESKLENSKKCSEGMKCAYNSIKTKYDNVTTKLCDTTKKYDALRRDSDRIDAVNRQLTIQCEKDREEHTANLVQLKKDLESEKLELDERYGKQLDELNEKHQRREKKLKAAHDHDLETYSAKRIEMKKDFERERSAMTKTFEREKTDILELHKTETKATLVKIENLEKELFTKIQQLKECSEELHEKNIALTDMEKRLEQSSNEINKQKSLSDQIAALLASNQQK